MLIELELVVISLTVLDHVYFLCLQHHFRHLSAQAQSWQVFQTGQPIHEKGFVPILFLNFIVYLLVLPLLLLLFLLFLLLQHGQQLYRHIYLGCKEESSSRRHYEALFALLGLLSMELASEEVVVDLIRLALALQVLTPLMRLAANHVIQLSGSRFSPVQDLALSTDEALPVFNRCAIHAVAAAYLNLICQLTTVPAFCQHIHEVCSAPWKNKCACRSPAVRGPFPNKPFLRCSSGNWVQTERKPLPFAGGCFHWESQVCEIPFSPLLYIILNSMNPILHFYFHFCHRYIQSNQRCRQAALFAGEGGRGRSLPSVQNHGGSRRERIQHRETSNALCSSVHWLGEQMGRCESLQRALSCGKLHTHLSVDRWGPFVQEEEYRRDHLTAGRGGVQKQPRKRGGRNTVSHLI